MEAQLQLLLVTSTWLEALALHMIMGDCSISLAETHDMYLSAITRNVPRHDLLHGFCIHSMFWRIQRACNGCR
jgi:hypothetical protein